MYYDCLFVIFFLQGLRRICTEIRTDAFRPFALGGEGILALRQEYLNDDWTSTNHYLGQEGHVYFGNSSSARRVYEAMNIPKNLTVSSYLSVSGRKYLCLALKEEYQLYLRLLVLSRNLSREHIEQSLSLARKNCPDLNLQLPLVNEKVEIVMSRSRGSYKL